MGSSRTLARGRAGISVILVAYKRPQARDVAARFGRQCARIATPPADDRLGRLSFVSARSAPASLPSLAHNRRASRWFRRAKDRKEAVGVLTGDRATDENQPVERARARELAILTGLQSVRSERIAEGGPMNENLQTI